jgi:hypothetical protein
MSFTDRIARNAKPAAKTIRIFDYDGLYLEVSPRGGKWWRLNIATQDKEKRVSLGIYPKSIFKKARARDRPAARAGQVEGAAPRTAAPRWLPRLARGQPFMLGSGRRAAETLG